MKCVLDNPQGRTEVGWQSSPDSRGSMEILWLCLTTLALCVWTAVHPNIVPSSKTSSSFYQRLGMMGLAVIFPEIILSSAWSQLRTAQRLAKKINVVHSSRSRKAWSNPLDNDQTQGALPTSMYFDQTPTRAAANEPNADAAAGMGLLPSFNFQQNQAGSDESYDRDRAIAHRTDTIIAIREPVMGPGGKIETWQLQQAYFAVMGGYAVEGTKFHSKKFKTTKIQRILTAEGVAALADADLLPEISKADVEERSNADLIAKFIVIFQVYWFLVQEFTRLIQKKAVTPLEAHTAVHVVCTIFVYAIWMRKPYNIGRPIVLKTAEIDDMVSLFTFDEVNRQLYEYDRVKFEHEREAYWKKRLIHTANNQESPDNIINYRPPPNEPILTNLTTRIRASLEDTEPQPTHSMGETLLRTLASSAQRAQTRLHKYCGISAEDIDRRKWSCLRDRSENFAIREVWGGWSTDSGHEMSVDKGIHLLFNLLYGAGHLAAWTATFPTSVEQWMWRSSGMMLASVPIWGCLWILWWKAFTSKLKILALFQDGDVDIVAAPFFFTVICAYVLARCFFLVESLASLRQLPGSAYATVTWTQYIPGAS